MKSGYVALIGRPNVGKSTLLNHLIGQKISITSRRPQTTRHRILGIKTTSQGQAIYVDTPGMHESGARALNRYMNRTANTALLDVDVIVWVTDSLQWQPYDETIVARLGTVECPVILAINKIDRIKDKKACLPFLQEASQRYAFAELMPISALHGRNLEVLEAKIHDLLPEGGLYFPEDRITDRTERFLAAEMIREKLVRRLAQELPHRLTVEIERFDERGSVCHIHAIIWVERDGQKSIVIGKKGAVLKQVGEQARADLEQLLDRKVYLNLWAKVKKGWSDNERALQSLGYWEQ